MARKKSSRRRRSFPKKVSRRRRSGGSLKSKMAAGFVYGAVRGTVYNFIQPMVGNIPGGQYADELTMGVADAILYKYAPGKRIWEMGLIIESAQVGQQVSMGMTNGTGGAGGAPAGVPVVG